MNKVPEALREVYKVVLKDKVRIESVKEGNDIHVWSREGGNNYKPLWVVLYPGSEGSLIDESSDVSSEKSKRDYWRGTELIYKARKMLRVWRNQGL
ncbi:hypothetical protein LCGC14_1647480 [marine sediment metagenome]|uniref:Uncharacterized protein n=1 Tax=marine sediment metagenome TaxID=412755 RepID=A0A0F9HYL8_9ZZZZ